jgi:hypothetical protein
MNPGTSVSTPYLLFAKSWNAPTLHPRHRTVQLMNFRRTFRLYCARFRSRPSGGRGPRSRRWTRRVFEGVVEWGSFNLRLRQQRL